MPVRATRHDDEREPHRHAERSRRSGHIEAARFDSTRFARSAQHDNGEAVDPDCHDDVEAADRAYRDRDSYYTCGSLGVMSS